MQILTNKLGYVESHKLMNGRLLLCSVAVGFALFALLWDYFHPFPQSRGVLIICVLSYPFQLKIGSKLALLRVHASLRFSVGFLPWLIVSKSDVWLAVRLLTV